MLAGLLFLGCGAALLFAFWYLLHTREWLSVWFFRQNDCFYRKDFWTIEAFTIQTKTSGDRFCMLAVGIATVGMAYSVFLCKKARTHTDKMRISIDANTAWYFAALTVWGLALWLYGTLRTKEAYDEVFSAVHCSGGNFFQCMWDKGLTAKTRINRHQ